MRQSTIVFSPDQDSSLFAHSSALQESTENLETVLLDLNEDKLKYSDDTIKLLQNFVDPKTGQLKLLHLLLTAKKFGRMERMIQALFKRMNGLFAMIVCLFLLSGGLAVGLSLNTVHKIDATKDTLVDPSSGKMMVKNTSAAASLPSSSTRRLMPSWMDMLSNISPSSDKSSSRLLEEDSDNTVIDDIIAVTIRADGMAYQPEVIEGMNCYSQEDVTGMFMSVATGVTATLAETNQTTNDFHVHQLGTSGCPGSDIVWTDVDVRLGCVAMIPSLDCTNMMARRDRHLSSEFADEDAMQDHHRALQEHVVNNIASGGGGNAAVNHNHRNLISATNSVLYYIFANNFWVNLGYQAGQATCPECVTCETCEPCPVDFRECCQCYDSYDTDCYSGYRSLRDQMRDYESNCCSDYENCESCQRMTRQHCSTDSAQDGMNY